MAVDEKLYKPQVPLKAEMVRSCDKQQYRLQVTIHAGAANRSSNLPAGTATQENSLLGTSHRNLASQSNMDSQIRHMRPSHLVLQQLGSVLEAPGDHLVARSVRLLANG